MSDRYEIKTVADFLSVPAEKRAECLADFSQWLSIVDEHKEIESLLDQIAGTDGAFSTMTDRFIWIDDSKRCVSGIKFTTGEDSCKTKP